MTDPHDIRVTSDLDALAQNYAALRARAQRGVVLRQSVEVDGYADVVRVGHLLGLADTALAFNGLTGMGEQELGHEVLHAGSDDLHADAKQQKRYQPRQYAGAGRAQHPHDLT